MVAIRGASVCVGAMALSLFSPNAWAEPAPTVGQFRGNPIPVPADAPRVRALDEPPAAASQAVVFVNFDGAQLEAGYDDSRRDRTQISELVGAYASYGSGTKRDAVMQAVRADWEDYDVFITDQRPTSGDYVMNMTGPSNAFPSNILGVAPLDCLDSQTRNNITFAFHSADDGFSAAVTATTISQEVAHSFGLEHVDEASDIMNPFNAGGDAKFLDQCLPIVDNDGEIYCVEQHEAECGRGDLQNSHAELLALFGTAAADTVAPVVEITSPADGDVFEPGASFTIEVLVEDDRSVAQLRLFSGGEEVGTDATPPWGWTVDKLPAGDYAFEVEARDGAGNVARSEVVEISARSGSTPAGGTGGTDEGDGSGGVDMGGPARGVGADADEAGCGCRSGARGPGAAAFLMFVCAGLGRWRRRP